MQGFLNLRNDNAQNIILKRKNSKSLELKEHGNELFKKKEYTEAIKLYQSSLESDGCDQILKGAVLSNLSQSFLNLGLFEDSLYYAEEALKVTENDDRSLVRKAKSLAYLLKFDQSFAVLDKVSN